MSESKGVTFHRKQADEYFEEFLLSNFRKRVPEREQLFGFYFFKKRFVREDLLNRAESELKQTIKLDPNDTENFLKLSYVYYIMNKKKDCERALREALRINPDNFWINLSLAYVVMERKRFNDAKKSFQKTLDLASSPHEERIVHYWLGIMFLRTDDYDKKNAEWRKIFPEYRNGMDVSRVGPEGAKTWEEKWFGGRFELRDEHLNLLKTSD